MKTEKLSLKSIKNVLSRAEMKKIMAGSGGGNCAGGNATCGWVDGLFVTCCAGFSCFPYGGGQYACEM